MIDLEKNMRDAICRHEAIYRYTPCMENAKPIINFIKLYMSYINLVDIHISLYEDAIKIAMKIRSDVVNRTHEVFIDYDYENPKMVFISTFKEGTLILKERPIQDFKITLDSILDILENP